MDFPELTGNNNNHDNEQALLQEAIRNANQRGGPEGGFEILHILVNGLTARVVVVHMFVCLSSFPYCPFFFFCASKMEQVKIFAPPAWLPENVRNNLPRIACHVNPCPLDTAGFSLMEQGLNVVKNNYFQSVANLVNLGFRVAAVVGCTFGGFSRQACMNLEEPFPEMQHHVKFVNSNQQSINVLHTTSD